MKKLINTGKLKKDEGFTIIESLVTLILLGLVVTFTVSFFNKLYSNPSLLLRKEALMLADTEIKNAVNSRTVTDTVYSNSKGNLTVARRVSEEKSLYNINVRVDFAQSKKEILSLNVYIKK